MCSECGQIEFRKRVFYGWRVASKRLTLFAVDILDVGLVG